MKGGYNLQRASEPDSIVARHELGNVPDLGGAILIAGCEPLAGSVVYVPTEGGMPLVGNIGG